MHVKLLIAVHLYVGLYCWEMQMNSTHINSHTKVNILQKYFHKELTSYKIVSEADLQEQKFTGSLIEMRENRDLYDKRPCYISVLDDGKLAHEESLSVKYTHLKELSWWKQYESTY